MSSLSDHYFYSDNYYLFSNHPLLLDHLPTPMSSSHGSSDSTAMHGGEVPIISFSNNNNSINVGDLNNNSSSSSSLVLPFEYSPDISSSPASMAALLGPHHQQRHGAGVSSNNHLMTYSALHDHYEHRDLWDNNNYQMAATGGVYEVGEECSSGVGGRLDSSNFWPPVYPIMTGENCQIDEGGGNGMGEGQRLEDSTLKIASRYSAEERKDRIIRYLKKRSQRNFNKTIKYACRKTLADKRVRVRGRFAKNNELSDNDHQTSTLATNTTTDPDDHIVDHLRHQDQQQSFYTTTTNDLSLLQMKPPSEEEWLQEAIASLMYHRVLPDVQLFH